MGQEIYQSGGEKVTERQKTALARARERARIAEGKIENAAQAMAETSPSWERRCHSIMAALELDFGGPTPDIPEQDSWYALNLKRTQDELFDAQMRIRELEQQLREREQKS